jgi:hypothetical protein
MRGSIPVRGRVGDTRSRPAGACRSPLPPGLRVPRRGPVCRSSDSARRTARASHSTLSIRAPRARSMRPRLADAGVEVQPVRPENAAQRRHRPSRAPGPPSRVHLLETPSLGKRRSPPTTRGALPAAATPHRHRSGSRARITSTSLLASGHAGCRRPSRGCAAPHPAPAAGSPVDALRQEPPLQPEDTPQLLRLPAPRLRQRSRSKMSPGRPSRC